MDESRSPTAGLHELAQFLPASAGLEQSLQQLAGVAEKMVDAASCSIVLLDERDEHDVRLRVFAAHGELPPAAFEETARQGQGSAGHVLATGKPLLVEDIRRSPFVSVARRLDQIAHSLISAPIPIDGRIVGVLNAASPTTGPTFATEYLQRLEVAALFVGKSVQVIQLQGLLRSRFAQMALAREAQSMVGGALAATSQNPNQVAKILAKSFFKEMTRAGFGSTQIIHAASEIIAQLNVNLGKHAKRLERR